MNPKQKGRGKAIEMLRRGVKVLIKSSGFLNHSWRTKESSNSSTWSLEGPAEDELDLVAVLRARPGGPRIHRRLVVVVVSGEVDQGKNTNLKGLNFIYLLPQIINYENWLRKRH